MYRSSSLCSFADAQDSDYYRCGPKKKKTQLLPSFRQIFASRPYPLRVFFSIVINQGKNLKKFYLLLSSLGTKKIQARRLEKKRESYHRRKVVATVAGEKNPLWDASTADLVPKNFSGPRRYTVTTTGAPRRGLFYLQIPHLFFKLFRLHFFLKLPVSPPRVIYRNRCRTARSDANEFHASSTSNGMSSFFFTSPGSSVCMLDFDN